MSKNNRSNYDKYGYTKTSIELNGKSVGAAECWKCKIPLHNTGITSLKRHRNRCKLDGANTTSNRKQNTKTTTKCFICNQTSIHCIPITAQSKYTKTRFAVFVRKFLNDTNSDRAINTDLDNNINQMSCEKCIDKINEYDLASFTAEQVAREMCEILRNGENSLAKRIDDNNHSETVEIIEVKPEITEIHVDYSLVDESLDGNDFVDFDQISIDKVNSDTDEKSMQEENTTQMLSEIEANTPNKSDSSSNSIEMKLQQQTRISRSNKTGESTNSVNRKRDTLDTNKTVQKKILTCDICTKEFSSKWNIKLHMQLHANFKEYPCDCGEKFNRRDKMLEHRKTHDRTKKMATKNDPYACDECSATFRILKEFKKHRTEHKRNEYPFRCPICNWDAKEESVLTKHVAMHDGLLPLQCVICKTVLAYKRNMIPHMRLHTGEKKYQCEKCGKEFYHLSSFSAHKRYVHDGVRTLKCEICLRLFIGRSDLKKHMVVHSGTRPFICPIQTCLKSFTHRHNMTEHCKIHDKNPPAKIYKCTFCPDTSFNRKSNLAKHLKKHDAIALHTNIQNKLEFD